MNPNKVKVKGSSACKCCEGTGKAFNAIDAEWTKCLYCGGSGLKRGQSVTTQPETDAEATAQLLDDGTAGEEARVALDAYTKTVGHPGFLCPSKGMRAALDAAAAWRKASVDAIFQENESPKEEEPVSCAQPAIEQPKTDAEAIIYDFEELVAPVVKALKAAYSLKRRTLPDIEWRGPNISNGLSLSPSERLTAENLQYSQESQGRFAIDEIIGIAVSLGIEQGKNLAAIEFKKQELLHQAALLIVTKERVNAALDNAPIPEKAPPDEPTDHEAMGAMIYRGKHEARSNGKDD